ncbi:translation initiation factor activity protein [Mycoemilia scoparia]|uniref:Translation initiation factor activity protein n=1 Tax=Mycoemilia scoparia TaxID=417184 RepID=A0A9W8DWF6_9FUNG|nr:translation initiation factor activity protein [Mycoemilia scoparia]
MAQPYVSDSILSTPNIGNSSSPILVDSEIDSSDDEPLIQIHNEAKTKNLSPKASGYAKNDEPPDSFESTTVLSSGKVLPPNVLEFYKILKGAKGPPITVVNNVDNEGPPPNFTYIDDNIWSPDVPQPSREAVCGCECSDGQSCFVPDPDNGTIESECLCMDLQSSVMPYDSNGLLITESGSSIYECNHMCSCGPDCHMRVVQKGRTVPLRIFKSKNRGWGVDAMTLIKKGQFICEYVGEIITYIEAEHRLSSEVELGTSYLFDLDSEVQEHEFSDFTIDARHYGNISRFINHSCEPNIEIRAVFIEHWDKRLHRLALFARRDIMPGEELAFDYNPGRKFIDSDSDLNHSENLVHKNNMPRSGQKASTTIPKHFICYCGTASCRGKIFT